MAYYVYPVYVLASLIVLILSIIFVIYTLHFYKFVKSRVVFIKLEPEEVGLNSWTFDLYPFTSSRIWRICGYAIVCLPATFQQASTILVCQCKVIKFKTVLPKTLRDENIGLVTPILPKKCFKDEESITKKPSKELPLKCSNCERPITEKDVELRQQDVHEDEETDSKTLFAQKLKELKRVAEALIIPEPTSIEETTCATTTANQKQVQQKTDNKQCGGEKEKKSHLPSITKSLRKQSRVDTVLNIDTELNEHNLSIMSIDNAYDTDYFIIPEAKPLQKLVVFNEPFNSSCPICLDDFELDEEIALLACHHGYHKDCLNKALRQNSSCPYCKSESNVRAFRVSEEIPLLWQTMSRRNSQAVKV